MKPFSHPLPPVPDPIQSKELKLTQKHAPIIQFDKLEPFLPTAVGYTLFEKDGPSPSFKRTITLPETCTHAIEYAIWWDWDIQHLYELEHLWVYLNHKGELIFAEGSFHGDFHALKTDDGKLPGLNGRLQAFSEAGKHAFAGSPEQLKTLRPFTANSCFDLAGQGDVLINHMFEGKIKANASSKRMCKRFMKAHAFKPGSEFSLSVDLQDLPLVPWQTLKTWIPERVNGWLNILENTTRIEAICLDCGDTLIDEGTEQKDTQGIVVSGELIPGAKDLLASLQKQGYRIALVADGFVKSFETLLAQHELSNYFEVQSISEHVGTDKPDARMFLTALEQLTISKADYGRVAMVGNNLSRDIKGANQLGLISIWLDWAPRRSKIPADEMEVPDYTIKTPMELLTVLEQLEIQLLKPYLKQLPTQSTEPS